MVVAWCLRTVPSGAGKAEVCGPTALSWGLVRDMESSCWCSGSQQLGGPARSRFRAVLGKGRVGSGEGVLASTAVFNEDPVGSGNWSAVLGFCLVRCQLSCLLCSCLRGKEAVERDLGVHFFSLSGALRV